MYGRASLTQLGRLACGLVGAATSATSATCLVRAVADREGVALVSATGPVGPGGAWWNVALVSATGSGAATALTCGVALVADVAAKSGGGGGR